MLKHLFLLLVTCNLLLLLPGCGFHPRGNIPLPALMSVTYIQAEESHSKLAAEITRIMRASGATVSDDRTAATAVLALRGDDTDRRVLSVDSGGKALEYALRYKVEYQLLDAAGNPLDEARTLTLTRDYTFSNVNVLGKTGEQELLTDELRRDMARAILRQLRR